MSRATPRPHGGRCECIRQSTPALHGFGVDHVLHTAGGGFRCGFVDLQHVEQKILQYPVPVDDLFGNLFPRFGQCNERIGLIINQPLFLQAFQSTRHRSSLNLESVRNVLGSGYFL